MRRRSRRATVAPAMQQQQHKRYLDLRPPPPRPPTARKRFGWLKTLIGLVMAAWLATIAIGPGDRKQIAEFLSETF